MLFSTRVICDLHHGELLVVAVENGGLFAYNTNTGELKWKVDRKPPGIEKSMVVSGVTTDNHGHLFMASFITLCSFKDKWHINAISVQYCSYWGWEHG